VARCLAWIEEEATVSRRRAVEARLASWWELKVVGDVRETYWAGAR
jgi:hypothetical protein